MAMAASTAAMIASRRSSAVMCRRSASGRAGTGVPASACCKTGAAPLSVAAIACCFGPRLPAGGRAVGLVDAAAGVFLADPAGLDDEVQLVRRHRDRLEQDRVHLHLALAAGE